ncbi:MAG: hypothetical protein ACREBS_06620 [Nitrososphaerales archaeon]
MSKRSVGPGGDEDLSLFARILKQTPTSVLERDISELLTDLKFLEDQVLLEPKLYEKREARAKAQQKIEHMHKKIRLAQSEYNSRLSRTKTR